MLTVQEFIIIYRIYPIITLLYIKLFITIFVITITWLYKIVIYQNKIFLLLFFGSFEVHTGNILR